MYFIYIMGKLNKNLVKAGVIALIKDSEADFIDRFSNYLREKPELVDYFFDGPLPIDDTIRQQIESLIKQEIPIEGDFIGIKEISIGFGWDSEQVYNVKYEANRYFDINNSPYDGLPVSDADHQVCRKKVLDMQINFNQLN